jgi:hypothetical protein
VCRSACAATPNRRRQLPTDRTRPTCRRRTRTAQVRRWTALAAARPGRSTYRRRESSRLGCARCRARIHLDQTPECSTGGGSANGAGVVVTAAGGRAFCHRDQPLGPAGGVDDSWRCRPGICSTSQSRSLASAAISSCGVRTPASCHKPPFRIIAATSSAIGVRHLPRPVDGRFVRVCGELCSGCGLLEAGEQCLA